MKRQAGMITKGGQMSKKSLNELCRMRDSLEYLLDDGHWLGETKTLNKLLDIVKYHIKHYEQYRLDEFGLVNE